MARDPGTLHIGRLFVRYRTAGDGATRAVAASLDANLTAALAERLDAVALPGADESVWLIRRLEVHARVAASWSPARIARALAAVVPGALSRTLERGSEGDAVRWFPDRAAFLGRFLLDCVDGRAADRWEYREFDDLVGRPSSTAIRALAARDPGTVLDALIRLTGTDLRRLLAHLAPSDADAVLGALATVAVPAAADPAPLVVEALRRSLDGSALSDEPRAAALALFLDVARRTASPPPAGTEGRAREVVRLAAIMRTTSPEEAEGLARALATGAWRAAGVHAVGRLPELVAWPEEARREAVRLVARSRSGSPEPTRPRTPPMLSTDLGGMFLLLPLLDELPWGAATATWPGLEGADGSRLAQYLAVIAALGADRNAAAVLDPVLRLALGVPPEVGARAIAAWSLEIDPAAIRRSIEVSIQGLRRAGKVSGAVTIAPLMDGVVAVDGGRGIWLGTASSAPASIGALVASIDAALGQHAAVAGSEPWIEGCLGSARPRPDPIDGRLLFRLATQARHATVGASLDLAPAVRDAVMLAAQALGRELAWRLPGLSRSSLPYLSDNVLSFPATVDVEPSRFVVRVGDPPLHLVLSLAGMNHRRFRLAATGDREWVLTREH